MKKLLFILGIIGLFILMGVGIYQFNNKSPIASLKDIKTNLTSYEISGILELVDDEALKTIKIHSLYKNVNSKAYYYVRLEDEQTGQVQSIVKNTDGVFVYAHGFNRAFKFNSKWPNNGFKPYILENILAIFDGDYELEKIRDGYIITANINDSLYPQNTCVKLLLNQNNVFQQVNLMDDESNEIMQFTITTYLINQDIDDNIFTLDSQEEISVSVSANENSPLYPSNLYQTELVDQLRIDDGYILRYKGDRYFTLVQKQLTTLNDRVVENYDEDFYIFKDRLLYMDKDSAVLIKDGIKTTIYSNSLNQNEMIDILLSLENNIVINE